MENLRFSLGVRRILWRMDWHHFVERWQMKIAWSLPRWLVYWVLIRAATRDKRGNVYPLNPIDRDIKGILDDWQEF